VERQDGHRGGEKGSRRRQVIACESVAAEGQCQGQDEVERPQPRADDDEIAGAERLLERRDHQRQERRVLDRSDLSRLVEEAIAPGLGQRRAEDVVGRAVESGVDGAVALGNPPGDGQRDQRDDGREASAVHGERDDLTPAGTARGP